MTILKRPIISEKALDLVASGKYSFKVDKGANKNQIKEMVKKLFKVDVREVKTMVMEGKGKRVGRIRRKVPGKPWKKAIVELKKGQKIEVFEAGNR